MAYPESSDISPGNDLLSAQYNNLRSDLLHATSGHDHTGAVDHGTRIPLGPGLEWSGGAYRLSAYVQLTGLGIGTAAGVANQITMVDGGTIGQTSGALLTFNDSDSSFQVDVGGKTALYLDDTDTNVLFGADAGATVDADGDNTFLGHSAGYSTTSGGDNVYVGHQAGYTGISEDWNVAIGVDAMQLAKASANVAIGYKALEDAGTTSDGDSNVAVGAWAMEEMDTGSLNVAIGQSAMENFVSGDCNVAIGEEAMESAAGSGEYNVAVGYLAMEAITSGGDNVAVGSFALVYITEGNRNIAIGREALTDLTTASDMIGIGYHAGHSTTTATDSILIGKEAGYTLTTGSSNVAVGYQAMQLTGVGVSYSVAMGYQALQDAGTTSDGDYNTAIGYAAMLQADQGEYNVAVGASALQNATDGDFNTAIGMEAMASGVGTPVSNVAVGYQAMYGGGTSPTGNVAVGNSAGLALDTGNYNVLIGFEAGIALTEGTENIIIGPEAGLSLTTGNYNILIGDEAGYNLVDGGWNTAVGDLAMEKCGTGANFNTAIGENALRDVGKTSDGECNTAVGGEALYDMDTGEYNVAVGYAAMVWAVAGDYNTAVGAHAMEGHSESTGSYNIGIGYEALYYGPGTGDHNIGIGMLAAARLGAGAGAHNVAIGYRAMYENEEASNNVVIGSEAGRGVAATDFADSVVIGYQAGFALTSGSNNVLAGYQSGLALTTGEANVFLGYQAGYSETGSNKLYIENSDSAEPLIYGEFDNDLVKVNGTVESSVGFIVEQVDASTYKYLQDWMNTTQSAGAISGGAITATTYAITDADDVANTFKVADDMTAYFTDGVEFTVSGSTGNDGDYTTVGDATFAAGETTITVANVPDGTDDGDIADGRVDVDFGAGMVKKTDDDIDGVTAFMDWPKTEHILLVDATRNVIYVDYNAGTPLVKATDDPGTDVDRTTKFPIGVVYRDGTTVHILSEYGMRINNITMRSHRRAVELRAFERSSGLVISGPAGLKVKVESGVVYHGYNRLSIAGVDTSGAGTFDVYYRDGGGGWTIVTDQTDIDDANWDDGTGALNSLTNNKYGVHWVYMDADGHMLVQYGQGDYKLAEAEDALIPDAPSYFDDFAIPVGKIIVMKDAGAFTSVHSAFEIFFLPSVAVNHDDLGNITSDQHHAQIHDVVGADHTVTGAKWSLVGASDVNTIGLLTPSADVSAGTEAILKSDASGGLALHDLTLANDLLLADGAVVGITGNERIQFNAAGTVQVLGADVTMDSDLTVSGGVNVGTATGAATNQVAIGAPPSSLLTIGMTINQAGNDDEILAFQSSDVAHGGTDIADTDTYGTIQKAGGVAGGLKITGLRDADGPNRQALLLAGFLGENADTTKSATGTAIIEMDAAQISGTGDADLVANGNIVAIRAHRDGGFATIWILDEDGDVYIDGTQNTYDKYDDAVMAWDATRVLADRGAEILRYNKKSLVRAGVMSPAGWISQRGTTKLLMGAVGQLWQQDQRADAEREAIRAEILVLQKRLNSIEGRDQ